jgi:hypothetical protein
VVFDPPLESLALSGQVGDLPYLGNFARTPAAKMQAQKKQTAVKRVC